ncbi:hypothetical protein [Alkalihalophilus marmarensis]|nr:hypothetical protein [Alkalihalophilus marmarensis]
MINGLIKDFLPVFSALIGIYLGSYLTSKNQRNLFKQQVLWEERKEYKIKEENKLAAYNKILLLNREHPVIDHDIQHGSPILFDVDNYEKYMRPILYDNYHFIDQDVLNCLENIEGSLKIYEYNQEITGEEHFDLCSGFNELLKRVKDHIKLYRDKTL